MSDPLVEMLKRHEGTRLTPYRDTVGKLTIGVGRNLSDVGISEAEALILLQHDIERAQTSLDDNLPWWRGLDPGRQRALIDLCFNMGIRGLLTFTHTLSCISQGDYAEATRSLAASLWARQVGPTRLMDITELLENGAKE